jgi:cytoskeletal protein CcmA (bactofilin family)
MSDTQVINTQNEDDESLTDSQVIPFKEAKEAIQQKSETVTGNVSVIGETLHFKGELSAGEDLIIEGKVEGQINQGKCCLTLKPNGELIANVNATKIFIEGKVDGDLAATVGVTIRESGNVSGNIIAPKVAIEDGAIFNGMIDMRSPTEAKRDK